MRFADFIVDMASVLNASRSVASRHGALRVRQFERYSQRFRSSSIRPTHDEKGVNRSIADTAADPTSHQSVTALGHGLGRTTKSTTLDSTTHGPKVTSPSQPDHIGQSAHDVPPSKSTTTPQLSGGEAGVEDPPPGIDLNVFRTERVATILGGGRPRTSPSPSQSKRSPATSHVLRTYSEALSGGRRVLDTSDQLLVDTRRTILRYRTLGIHANVFASGHMCLDTGESIIEHTRGHLLEAEARGAMAAMHHANDPEAVYSRAERAMQDGDGLIRDVRQHLDSHSTSSMAVQTLSSKDESHPKTPNEPTNPAISDTPTNKMIPDRSTPNPSDLPLQSHSHAYTLRESKVPSTRLSRLWNYSGLAAGMLGGALTEGVSRAFGRTTPNNQDTSLMLNSANMERLVSKLSRMRGAALKMGQMMSFQDAKMLPPPIQEVLQRVQDRADYMPSWQRDRVLASNLGADWRDLFVEFEEKPLAAASIGQVHKAVLRENNESVAVKVQFPGVADSINSDLDNLSMILAASNLLPKGLYLHKTIDNARTELAWECDYEREATCASRYRTLLSSDSPAAFEVPAIYPQASGRQVLTMQYMEGLGVTRFATSPGFTQEDRDWIGTQILRLCLREITEFRFMQTDPNWTNFLFNPSTRRLELLDFGASREFPVKFVSLYTRLLVAASRLDRSAVKALSEQLGYLTGLESKTMLNAHIASVTTLAEPFLETAPDVYDFRDQSITERVKGFIPTMVRERLAPPPEETYSLHRKLSGAFLLCARLGSRVPCRRLFVESVGGSGFVGAGGEGVKP